MFQVQHEPDRASYISHSSWDIQVHCWAVPPGVQHKLVIFHCYTRVLIKVCLETFQGYDWLDTAKNTEHHGNLVPPMYNLSQVTTPVALYWGDNDWYTAKQV